MRFVRMPAPNARPSPGGAPGPRRDPPPARRAAGSRPSRSSAAPTSAPTPTPRHGWRAIPAPLRWIGAFVLLLIAAIALFIYFFQWNWLRGPIDRYATAKLNRPVAIHGDLSGHVWTWTPSLTARDVTVAQPPWAGSGPMATLPKLTVAIDLKALIHGKGLVLTLVEAEQPKVALQREASGRNNWTFGPPTATPQPLRLPAIRHFTIDDGRLTLNDARRHLRFTGVISSNERITGF